MTFFFLLLQQFSIILLKGAKSRPRILLESLTKMFYHKSIDTVTQNLRGVTDRHCLSKAILSQQRIRH